MKFKDKTRGGFPVRIYATDGKQSRPIHGAYFDQGEWHHRSWKPDGKQSDYGPCAADLLPLREPSEAAVEAAWVAFGKALCGSGRDMTRAALRAAYEIDGIDGVGK